MAPSAAPLKAPFVFPIWQNIKQGLLRWWTSNNELSTITSSDTTDDDTKDKKYLTITHKSSPKLIKERPKELQIIGNSYELLANIEPKTKLEKSFLDAVKSMLDNIEFMAMLMGNDAVSKFIGEFSENNTETAESSSSAAQIESKMSKLEEICRAVMPALPLYVHKTPSTHDRSTVPNSPAAGVPGLAKSDGLLCILTMLLTITACAQNPAESKGFFLKVWEFLVNRLPGNQNH
eukprot:TRINITY_DN8085_c0_g1_i1.p1 TRINITY_DN8085_c0_g1~~TRINITY_DN8085_c0_g1_i1.p1  ORF type:complete len:234 (-),score=45.11 TRINITY_DN8085_c0_g1_i1:379-1080(-)